MTNSNKFIFVPGCMLCPTFQAVRSNKNRQWVQTIMPYLVEKEINVISMPCPEVTFGGIDMGMKRAPHGIKYYKELNGFESYCALLGKKVITQINELHQAGLEIIAIVGIEHSPTCAASYMYTREGTQKRQGLFVKNIYQTAEELNIPIIGINRNYPNKFLSELKKIMEKKDDTYKVRNIESKQ